MTRRSPSLKSGRANLFWLRRLLVLRPKGREKHGPRPGARVGQVRLLKSKI